ncbi:recombinase family protein [Caviibacterium pharyngocola]|uniref:Resolvase n=1 Tax=Caviibacterium pharyngocola TaxID=28159 RepID=A0A2M8RUN8_9PAST|nr:recombinase family protein [Caviibacterium pharyngocola]PJG82591.1 resolvase [Caviibacterium pharyngocola]
MSLIGYARVSTQRQDLNEQLDALKAFGCKKIFTGKHSGKALNNQKQLDELFNYIREGDTVVVTKFDRLGRSLSQCLNALEYFKRNNIGFIALDKSIDTNQKSDPVSMALIHLLGLLAELERSFIVERTQEGKRAKIAAGNIKAKGGRPSKITPEIKQKMMLDFQNGISLAEAAKKYQISEATVTNVKRRLKTEMAKGKGA